MATETRDGGSHVTVLVLVTVVVLVSRSSLSHGIIMIQVTPAVSRRRVLGPHGGPQAGPAGPGSAESAPHWHGHTGTGSDGHGDSESEPRATVTVTVTPTGPGASSLPESKPVSQGSRRGTQAQWRSR